MGSSSNQDISGCLPSPILLVAFETFFFCLASDEYFSDLFGVPFTSRLGLELFLEPTFSSYIKELCISSNILALTIQTMQYCFS